MINYDTHVKPYGKNFKMVKIEEAKITEIDQFVKKIIKAKKNEIHHLSDNKSHYKRYYTGILGEVALEKYLNIEGIVDWTIGNSNDYHKPDLKNLGLNVGIKTVEYGSFPLIFNESYSSEIIMIRWKNDIVYICGVANPKVLNTYSSKTLINDKQLRERGTKTGFYGFQHLEIFENLEELRKITKR